MSDINLIQRLIDSGVVVLPDPTAGLTPPIARTFALNTVGLVTTWTDADGIGYTNIVYDTQDRIVNWRESLSVDGTVVAYDYTAVYNNNGTVTVTRSPV